MEQIEAIKVLFETLNAINALLDKYPSDKARLLEPVPLPPWSLML